jgi:hypothetical protein
MLPAEKLVVEGVILTRRPRRYVRSRRASSWWVDLEDIRNFAATTGD